MILYHGKVLAEHQLGTSVKNCVFTIPSSWNLHQREILYSSAKLADLYPLTFIHENTAVALNYAFDRQDVNETHNVLFYNMGSSSTKINLVEFTAVNVSGRNIENLRVLGEIETDLVSGREFDYKLADLLVEHFDKLPQRKGIKIKNNFFISIL